MVVERGNCTHIKHKQITGVMSKVMSSRNI